MQNYNTEEKWFMASDATKWLIMIQIFIKDILTYRLLCLF